MKEGKRELQLEEIRSETVMDGADMRAKVYTLAAGQRIPWHYHSNISDLFFCLDGPMVVETRAPHAKHLLQPGERCTVPPMTAHCVYGSNDGPCRYLILQGVGEYDNHAVGGATGHLGHGRD
jgi:quercetin dioxygenase-like cupin family protein